MYRIGDRSQAGNQLRADRGDVVDFTDPPSGYSYGEWLNLQQSIHNTFGNNEQ
jgi:hypothetical protein